MNTKQTAANNVNLRQAKADYNHKIYKRLVGLMNEQGIKGCVEYLKAFYRPECHAALEAKWN